MATGDLHKKLNPHVELSPEAIELRAWLKKNKENFLATIRNPDTGEDDLKYETWEIAKFARWNGFTDKTIFDQISHIRYAIKGGHIEHGAAMKLYVFEETCESVDRMKQALQDLEDERTGQRQIRLEDRWKEYVDYATTGLEWAA